jgi:CHAT domain
MRATGTDIVAYLVAAGEHGGGHAIVVRPDGSAHELPLPRLDVAPGTPAHACSAAQRDLLSTQAAGRPDTQAAAAARDRWARSLHDLAGWAWPAAVQRLLAATPSDSGRPPRLLLIPLGLLGIVPWHAASYRHSSGETRYACQQAVFSYAASARQLADAVGRETLPMSAGQVLVADPVERSYWATREVEALRAAYYPGATVLGRQEPRATPRSVLAALPGGSRPSGAALLHLACHGQTGASPAQSGLRLRADQATSADQGTPAERPLPVDQILRQAARKPAGAPGGLVVLAACVSDVATSDYDEALTLASAFITAGAVTVVGTRWNVSDVHTALLMFMFHHYLNAGQSPADALRRAQAWMLDAGREAPADMSAVLAQEIPYHDLTDLVAWAGFAHQGR